MRRSLLAPVLACFLIQACRAGAAEAPIPKESAEQAGRRHEQVAGRRKGVAIFCHRGASVHAHENTLEAFRATFELGGDGNEFDIRQTKDGVLVVFHDDMLDRLLEAYGDVSDYTWAELRSFRFRSPGPLADECLIPTLVEVFELHRKYGGLMNLDIKRSGYDKAIADLLTRMDLWDHVAYCGKENGPAIVADARFKPRRYKAGLYLDRGEMFPDAIAAALKRVGDDLMVEDPCGAVLALGRKIGKLSKGPVTPQKREPRKGSALSEREALAFLSKADDWRVVAETDAAKEASGRASSPRSGRRAACWRRRSHRRRPSPSWRIGCGAAVCTRTGCITDSTAPWPCAPCSCCARRMR
ncbi:MAG: glycerophosphodiester phosphodiesterase family protein [Gemmataceae bacterium]